MPSRKIIFNGEMIDAGENLHFPNIHQLPFGTGVFETMKFKPSKIVLFAEHIKRLQKGLIALGIKNPLPPNSYLHDGILELLKTNEEALARIRLTVFKHELNSAYLIETFPIEQYKKEITLGLFKDFRKEMNNLSNHKLLNYPPYKKAINFACENSFDDAVLLNTCGRICETSIANIFIFADGKIFTPALREGCIAGIIRQFLLQQLQGIGYTVSEKQLTIDSLLNAEEIFTTNSIRNIRAVKNFNGKRFATAQTVALTKKFAETFPEVFA